MFRAEKRQSPYMPLKHSIDDGTQLRRADEARPGHSGLIQHTIFLKGRYFEGRARGHSDAFRDAGRVPGDVGGAGGRERTAPCAAVRRGDHWDRLLEAMEEEEDLLDMAPFLSVNSRLGCQVVITRQLARASL